MTSATRIHLKVENSLGVVQFDHPPTRNSLTEESMIAIEEFVAASATNDALRVLLITGVGDLAFSSGADISSIDVLRRLEPAVLREKLHVWQKALLALERLEKPVIAAINGVCAGGGAELALACDIRLAAKRAKIGFPEVRLGLGPDMGSSQRLARIVGIGWAKHMILTGDLITADQASHVGLVTGLIPDDNFESKARDFAEQLALSASPRAVGVAKRLIERNFASEIETALERELLAQSTLYPGPDVVEAYNAFREKRSPNWE